MDYSSVDSLRRMDVEPSISTMCSGTSDRALLSRLLLPFIEFLNRDEGTDEDVSESAELQNLAVLT